MIAATFAQGMVVGALMLLMAEIMVAIAFISLAAPSQCDDDDDERPSDPNNPFDRERDRIRNEHNKHN